MTQTPTKKRFSISARSEVGATRKGNLYRETDTNVGTVAFWGNRNIEQVQDATLPVDVERDVIESNWPQHQFWVLERSLVSFESPHGEAPSPRFPQPEFIQAEAGATVDELNQWRHRLLKVLDHLFGESESKEGPISRITGLKKEGRIPRRTAALMIVVTEVRNAAAYERSDGPTVVETEAARAAWKGVCEWATKQGVDSHSPVRDAGS